MIALPIARALEEGRLGGSWAEWSARLWGAIAGRRIVRPLVWRPGVRVVVVGGATLGGSGKTPVAIACARAIAAFGARTALVGHAHGARPRRACVVGPDHEVDEVGDEAIVAARTLAEDAVHVVVGPSRAAATTWASEESDVLVLDGISQTRPERATLALLAVDAVEPWGRVGAFPPRGDLRASVATLLEACDAIVPVGDGAPGAFTFADSVPVPVLPAFASFDSRGARLESKGPRACWIAWETLRSMRVGLVTALARPNRVARMLVRRGVSPCAIVRAPDHGPLDRSVASRCRRVASREAVEVWLATAKCAVHARRHPLGAPLAVVEHSLELSDALRSCLRRLAVP